MCPYGWHVISRENCEMEIGRIPATAPGTSATKVGGNTVRAVQTILPQHQTVTRSGHSESTPLTFREVTTKVTNSEIEKLLGEYSARENKNREVRKEIEIDRDTSALVFRAIDAATGDIECQHPEEARQKLSAYIEKAQK